MEDKMEATPNPYCSPVTNGFAESFRHSGLRALFASLAIFLACLLVTGYFVLMEIPCVLAGFDQQNAPLPQDLLAVNRAAPFVLNYWFIVALAALSLILVMEWRFAGDIKNRIRCWMGVGIGMASLTFTFWLVWATLSRAGWQLLYRY